MKFLFNFRISVLVLFFIPIACLAQAPIASILTPDTSRAVYIGLDVSKNIPSIFQNYFFQKSRIVEGTAMFSIGRGTFCSVSLGYSYIHADPVFKNLNYSNEGVHIKVGADYMPVPIMGIGGNLTVSSYQEYGKFTMRGPYYGNLDLPFPKRSLTAFGLEFHYYLLVPLGKRLSLSPVSRLIIHSPVGINKNGVDSYYIPGMGITSRDISVTVNASVALVYKFPLPNR